MIGAETCRRICAAINIEIAAAEDDRFIYRTTIVASLDTLSSSDVASSVGVD
jgi:hypothetical protein